MALQARSGLATRVDTQALLDRVYNGPLHLLDGTELYPLVQSFHQQYLQDEVDLRTAQRGAYLVKDRETFMRHRVVNALPEYPHNANPSPLRNTEGDEAAYAPFLHRRDRERTNAENEALKREHNGAFASLTKDAILVLATCALGAIVQGWGQENIVGANNFWPEEFKVGDNKTIKAVVNAITYFTASLCGVWLTDPFSSYFGRRGALFCSALCSFIAPVGAAASPDWQSFLVFRIIQGLGMGAKGAVIPVLMAEVSPPAMRARILVGWQTFVAFGILIGAVVNNFLSNERTWRWALGISAIPALTFACFCYAIPESPRWLVENCEYAKAYRALARLRETKLQATGELYLLYTYSRVYAAKSDIFTAEQLQAQLEYPPTQPAHSPYLDFLRRFRDLFCDDRNRRAAFAACSVMAAQQMSGINIFAFVTTAGEVMSLEVKIGFGIINTIFSAAAYFLIQPMGRRTLLLTSLGFMVPPLAVLVYSVRTATPDTSTNVSIAFILIYTAIYSPGAGVIPFMYSSEVFDQKHRQVGMSLAVATNFSLAGVVTLVPLITSVKDWRLAVGAFLATDVLAVILVWLFMRTDGTRANSLEDMHDIFAQTSRRWVRYQIDEAVPKTLRCDRSKRTFRQWCRAEASRAMPVQGRSLHEHELSEAADRV